MVSNTRKTPSTGSFRSVKPSIVLMALLVIGLAIPWSVGERVSFAITLMLVIVVFLSMVILYRMVFDSRICIYINQY